MAISLFVNGILEDTNVFITEWPDAGDPTDNDWFILKNQDNKHVERNSSYGYLMLVRKGAEPYSYSFCINKNSSLAFLNSGDGVAVYDNGAPLPNLNLERP